MLRTWDEIRRMEKFCECCKADLRGEFSFLFFFFFSRAAWKKILDVSQDTLLDLRNYNAPRAWRVFSKRSPTASMLPSDDPSWPRIVLTPLDSGSSRQSSDILDVIVPLFRSNMRPSLSRYICFSSIAFVFHESFDQQRLLLCPRIENFGQDVATYSKGKG